LIAAYEIAPADQARFRARLTFLQRGGLFGAERRPGKGTRLIYQPHMLHRLIFCLELAELGVGPAVQLRLVDELWDKRIRNIFSRADKAVVPDDVVLLMTSVSLMVAGWAGAVPDVNACTLSELAGKITLAMHGENRALLPRLLAVNLSARLRRFHDALNDVHLKFEQPPIEVRTTRRGRGRREHK